MFAQNEIKTFFKDVQLESTKKTVDKFTGQLKDAEYTPNELVMIVDMCNFMLKERLKPTPEFELYLNNLIAYKENQIDTVKFSQWHSVQKKVLKEMKKEYKERFKQFIAAVRAIDCKAAGYLGRMEKKGLMTYIPYSSFHEELNGAFIWKDTKQGHDYWSDIHDKLYKKVHQSYGLGTFLKHVTNYIESYGLPEDAPTLLLILDTKDQATTLSTIGKLREIYPKLPQQQKDDTLRKLSIVAMSDKSKEVRLKAEEIMGELS